MQGQILWYFLLGPYILVEVVVKNKVLIVGISEKVDFRDGLEFIVKILVSVSVGELHHWVFQAPDALEHGVHDYMISHT